MNRSLFILAITFLRLVSQIQSVDSTYHITKDKIQQYHKTKYFTSFAIERSINTSAKNCYIVALFVSVLGKDNSDILLITHLKTTSIFVSMSCDAYLSNHNDHTAKITKDGHNSSKEKKPEIKKISNVKNGNYTIGPCSLLSSSQQKSDININIFIPESTSRLEDQDKIGVNIKLKKETAENGITFYERRPLKNKEVSLGSQNPLITYTTSEVQITGTGNHSIETLLKPWGVKLNQVNEYCDFGGITDKEMYELNQNTESQTNLGQSTHASGVNESNSQKDTENSKIFTRKSSVAKKFEEKTEGRANLTKDEDEDIENFNMHEERLEKDEISDIELTDEKEELDTTTIREVNLNLVEGAKKNISENTLLLDQTTEEEEEDDETEHNTYRVKKIDLKAKETGEITMVHADEDVGKEELKDETEEITIKDRNNDNNGNEGKGGKPGSDDSKKPNNTAKPNSTNKSWISENKAVLGSVIGVASLSAITAICVFIRHKFMNDGKDNHGNVNLEGIRKLI